MLERRKVTRPVENSQLFALQCQDEMFPSECSIQWPLCVVFQEAKGRSVKVTTRPYPLSAWKVKGRFTHTMPFPCLSPAATLSQPYHYPATLRQCRNRAGCPHAVSGRPMLIHTYHAFPLTRTCRGLERSLSEWHIRGMAGERHSMYESNTAAFCKSNGKDTI
jgi:hypothetical protein